jgi:hypothetical protein
MLLCGRRSPHRQAVPVVSSSPTALATIVKMQQEQDHHQQAMRASALNSATTLLAADSDEADALLADVLPQGVTGVRRLELLTNTLLTFIETGQFLEDRT